MQGFMLQLQLLVVYISIILAIPITVPLDVIRQQQLNLSPFVSTNDVYYNPRNTLKVPVQGTIWSTLKQTCQTPLTFDLVPSTCTRLQPYMTSLIADLHALVLKS
jgi:hypothetical protein